MGGSDEEPCGEEFTIDGVDIMGGWPAKLIQKVEDQTLVCSLHADHKPRNVHSDGVTDWTGDEQ